MLAIDWQANRQYYKMTGKPEKAADFYEGLDNFQRQAQAAALKTAHNMDWLGVKEVTASRGEATQVIDLGDGRFMASVNEELGTKNIIADAMWRLTGKSFDFAVGFDTVSAQINDLITVGAMPISSHAHFVAGDKSILVDPVRSGNLIAGYQKGCNEAGANWLGGETGLQQGNVEPGRIVLSGSASGIINQKERLILGDKLAHGDMIIYLPSTGVHTNGYTAARELADSLSLPNGYETFLPDGTMYGEALLEPTPIYVDAVRSLFEAGVDVHYMSNITGHGWRKLMRADRELAYSIAFLPENRPPLFDFIQKRSGKSDEEMYATFNMGMGFAIYVARDHMGKALGALQNRGWQARLAGHVEDGPKQVVIEPLELTFGAGELAIR